MTTTAPQKPRRIYVCHPLRGPVHDDISAIFRNRENADRICRRIRADHPDALILSPLHAFDFSTALGSQAWVIGQCLQLLSCATEIWAFGDWRLSEGCNMEMDLALKLGIPSSSYPENWWQVEGIL